MLWKEAIWWIRCVRWVRNLGFIARECLLARHYTSKKGLMSSNPGIMSHTRASILMANIDELPPLDVGRSKYGRTLSNACMKHLILSFFLAGILFPPLASSQPVLPQDLRCMPVLIRIPMIDGGTSFGTGVYLSRSE